MPLYAYKCSDCEREFEKIQKMSDPNPPCPLLKEEDVDGETCGGKTERLISQGSFALKGTGWYSDSYA